MMGITACRDVWFNAALGTRGQCCRAKVASIQRRCLRSANLRRNSRQRGLGLLAIVGVIGKGTSDNEQTPLINRYLRVVILLKARMRRAFHDARLRVGLGKDTARCIPFGALVSASSPPNPAC